ncbi:MAG: hypothetical protein ACK4OM_01175 [Alphaproteobacteria bacterium]
MATMLNADFNIEDDKVHEVVAVFHSVSDMENAIDKLTENGFNPAEISMLADENKVKEKLGNVSNVEDIMDNPDAPRVSYIANENIGAAQGGLIGGLAYVSSLAAAGSVIAVGGPLSAVFTTAAVIGGTFATLGMILGKLIGQHHVEYIENQLAHGGIITWVKIASKETEKQALEILKEFNADYLHTHVVDYQNIDNAHKIDKEMLIMH